jgi:hypothetical protein
MLIYIVMSPQRHRLQSAKHHICLRSKAAYGCTTPEIHNDHGRYRRLEQQDGIGRQDFATSPRNPSVFGPSGYLKL